ncbi:MAG: hypothetical protein ACRYF2_11970 [Janthinobacterium lividum]
MTPPSSTHASRIGLAVLVACAIVLLIPVLITPLPPLTDYPNHLARMWILSGGPGTEAVAAFYRVQLDTFTNVAMDVIAVTLGRIGGWELAGHTAIGAAVLLPAIGGALLWRALHGRWHWWMLAFGLLVWGQTMMSAFLNFQISVGLAMLFAALEPALERLNIPLRIVIRTVLSVILLLAHPFGWIFYGLLVAALIFGPRLRGAGAVSWRDVFGRWIVAGLGFALVLVLFVVLTPQLPGSQEHSGLSTLGAEFAKGMMLFKKDPTYKLLNLFIGIRSYDNRFDLLTFLVLVAPLALAAGLRTLRIHAGLLLLSLALIAIYVLCPDYLLGAGWVSSRFAVMFIFAAALACDPVLPRWTARAAAALLALMLVARTAYTGFVWQLRQADVAALAKTLSALPEGASVLAVEQQPREKSRAPLGRYTVLAESNFRHLASMALPWRHAFVPQIFSARGKQPLVVLPPWDEISEANGGRLADEHALDPQPSADALADIPDYIYAWRVRFGYVVILDADVPDKFGPFTVPPELTLVRDDGFSRLYRITPPH